MIRCDSPRCCDCAQPLRIVEPFVDGVGQQCRCPCCSVHLRVCRVADGWTIATTAEHGGERTVPLPVAANPALRHRFLTACRSVARLLQPCEGVEPGMAAIKEQARGRTVIHSACNCGEPVLIETGRLDGARRDGKRPHYPESGSGTTVLRCRSCCQWLGDTCPDAAFDAPEAANG